MFRFTPEQKEFIRSNVQGQLIPELTDLINSKFGIELKQSQIRAFVKNNGLKSGVDSRFKPGSVPFNKGKKGLCQGGVETQFKKGHTPHNYVPVGSERVNGYDYVDVKIADPNKWRGKHNLIWEQHNGPIPKGHVVIFGDGNRRNFDTNNLILVSRAQLAVLNKKGLIQNNAELTRTGIIMADIYRKMRQRKRGEKRN
ncbi:HNH endonuclease signature motif containing protein [Paenibacillus sp. FSL R5-0527]|uniref:HNH endonuclease signature motif containing protein n=1 Tax=Paenibacillus sp. FSL R5-0527 TaxID=2975321 RepID=UPI000979D057|nr:HNH endonuclease [Paenibacillus macerans]